MSQASELLWSDLEFFAERAFRELKDGQSLGLQDYLSHMCHEISGLVTGDIRRLLVNVPPRHLKTFLGAVCLPAWKLGRDPSTRIMLLSYSQTVAEASAYQVKHLMESAWYQKAFGTRIADNWARSSDFGTTRGGYLLAMSAVGSITGRGGDLIIYDDPLAIEDAGNLEQIEKVNWRFDTVISSRLDRPKTGQIAIIAHRLHEHDLSGHVLEQGGWRHVRLPLIAVRTKTFDIGDGRVWVRPKGNVLRPDEYTDDYIEKLKKKCVAPDFETFYQQSPERGARFRIKRKHFPIVSATDFGDPPVVLSIDPGKQRSATGSYSVIQAWVRRGKDHLLVDQYRERCDFDELRSALWRFVRRHRPAACLIENAANGSALIAEVRRKPVKVVAIELDGRTKATRLNAHIAKIRRGRIHLPETADWTEAFIREFMDFPGGPNDDQVDATTQYLHWIAENPSLEKPPPRALGVRATSSSWPEPTPPESGKSPGLIQVPSRGWPHRR